LALLEHIVGVGIRAHGASLEEPFEQATLGLAEVLGAWQPGQGGQVGVVLDADDLGSLLIDWLNKVVHLHKARGVALGGVRIERVADGRIEGSVVLAPTADGRLRVSR
jgi:SHS2 domain-containing protein